MILFVGLSSFFHQRKWKRWKGQKAISHGASSFGSFGSSGKLIMLKGIDNAKKNPETNSGTRKTTKIP